MTNSQDKKVDSEYSFSVSVENEQDAVTKAQSEDTNASTLRYSVIRDGFRIVLIKKNKRYKIRSLQWKGAF